MHACVAIFSCFLAFVVLASAVRRTVPSPLLLLLLLLSFSRPLQNAATVDAGRSVVIVAVAGLSVIAVPSFFCCCVTSMTSFQCLYFCVYCGLKNSFFCVYCGFENTVFDSLYTSLNSGLKVCWRCCRPTFTIATN